MSAEDKFNEIVAKFKASIKESVSEAVDSIHFELLPYVNDDTENNARYRAADIVNDIIAKRFTIEDDKIKCGEWKVNLTSNDYDHLVNALAEKCSDEAANKKIEKLERQLKEAYSSKY